MNLITAFTPEYEEYARDESRTTGTAQSISFPTNEQEIKDILSELKESDCAITVQGARTGLAAGAVPSAGHIMNLSRMTTILGLRQEGERFFVRMQPGVVLANLRKMLANKTLPTAGWDSESLSTLDALYAGPDQFFPTDPTETSAALGGMVACNASGARSYGYGPVRPHVSALRVVLSSGETLALKRGETYANGRTLTLTTEQGTTHNLQLPTYTMPKTKNASGYFVAENMDAIDLFIGSDGTLGIITEIELALMSQPPVVWGVSCFFENESAALDFTVAVRPTLKHAMALEYFDEGALNILRSQRSYSAAFASLPAVDERLAACVYVELDCDSEEQALEELYLLGDAMNQVGAHEEDTWVARNDIDRERQRFFRHAVPESVNMLIDERRRTDPTITKLGSDMSVPDEHLHDVVELYRSTLTKANLESAAWGHIGNNHLHVNVLPRNAADFTAGKELFASWAKEITKMGGAVSAEHGVGKIKRNFLEIMYGPDHIREMAKLKLQLDPAAQLGRGNLFSEQLLDELAAKGGESA